MIGFNFREDITNALQRDPAARSRLEVFLVYPGLHAVWGYRWANFLWRHNFKLLARIHMAWIRAKTGIEIHPAAVIGRRFFIDHGMGVVIGETSVIGDDVLMYHDVTLGARGFSHAKRHPTIGNRVILGAGARIIGDIRVHDDASVATNATIVKDHAAKTKANFYAI
ncbi:MAG: serine O-acetyltransferase EpsC [Actinomycetes bacterium]